MRMNREQKINELLARTDDDIRRLALDIIDDDARRANTFGSKPHRDARDKVEAQHDSARKKIEGLSEQQLDAAIASGRQEAATQ